MIPNNALVSINPIGSTAINNIKAKDIIDTLIETTTKEELHAMALLLTSNGYIKISEDNNRVSLNKGYTKNECS